MQRAKRLVLCVVSLAAAAGCGGGDGAPTGPGVPISVYTRNLYLGADITPLVMIDSPSGVPPVAATLWQKVQASDFPSRAQVLADEIVALAPDLIALQEVTLYRSQVPSDYQPGDPPNATEVVLDFLDSLMNEIWARGGTYHVVGESPNVDAELPVDDGAGGLFDLRLTDRDVMVARDGVDTGTFMAFQFGSKFSFPAGGVGGVPIALQRGWSRVDATVGEAHFTFANTHLEIQSLQPFQSAQATELLFGIGSLSPPVLLLGDFNSAPGMNSYPLLTAQFKDAWNDGGGGDPGFTCCQQEDLMNADSIAGERIDLVLTRGRFRVNDMSVIGTDPGTGRTPSGLWASDHFGVFAHLELVP